MKWIKDGLYGWLASIIPAMILRAVFRGFHLFEIIANGILGSLLPGIIGGVLGGRFIKHKWGFAIGGIVLTTVWFIINLA